MKIAVCHDGSLEVCSDEALGYIRRVRLPHRLAVKPVIPLVDAEVRFPVNRRERRVAAVFLNARV